MMRATCVLEMPVAISPLRTLSSSTPTFFTTLPFSLIGSASEFGGVSLITGTLLRRGDCSVGWPPAGSEIRAMVAPPNNGLQLISFVDAVITRFSQQEKSVALLPSARGRPRPKIRKSRPRKQRLIAGWCGTARAITTYKRQCRKARLVAFTPSSGALRTASAAASMFDNTTRSHPGCGGRWWSTASIGLCNCRELLRNQQGRAKNHSSATSQSPVHRSGADQRNDKYESKCLSMLLGYLSPHQPLCIGPRSDLSPCVSQELHLQQVCNCPRWLWPAMAARSRWEMTGWTAHRQPRGASSQILSSS